MLLQIADVDISSTFRERSLFMSGGGMVENFQNFHFFRIPPPQSDNKIFQVPPQKKIIIEDLTDECFCLQIPQFVSK